MPFCTACGKQNPDDARFCSQCGTRLVTPTSRDPARRGSRRASRPRRSPSGSAATRSRPRTDSSAPSTRPRSTRCPPGTRCSSCSAAPASGSRFLLDADVVDAGRHPDSEIFLDDVTVSRRHAEFHRTGDTFTVSDVGQPQRHLRQPRPDRLGRSSPTATRSRSASTAWCSSPGTRAADGVRPLTPAASGRAGAAPRARMNIGQVLERLRPDFPGITIPKIRFLEDKGLIKPERTPAGYRKFSHDDVERLRYVLRMQRDHYLPLKVIGEHLDAIDRGLEPPPIEGVVPTVPAGRARRRRAARAPSRSPAATTCGSPAGAAQDRRDLRRAARPARAVRPDRARAPAPGTTTPTRWSSPAPPASSPTSASSPATCARSRPPPTARSASSSRSSPPSSAAATPPPRARAEDAVSEIAALSVRLHATLVKTGLRRR